MVSQLHLPSLNVEGLRGIRSLELPNLGRVTLLAGENGTGKTTMLEAIRIYASRGDERSLTNLIEAREELVPGSDMDGDEMLFPNFAALFHDHDSDDDNTDTLNIRISAGRGTSRKLTLRLEDDPKPEVVFSEDVHPKRVHVSVGKRTYTFPVGPIGRHQRSIRRYHLLRSPRRRNPEAWPEPIVHEALGPGLLHASDVARLWDSIALTKAEDFVTEALRLVVGNSLERLAVIGDPTPPYRGRGRRVVARLDSSPDPIPLKRLGDGAQRFLGMALALANCRNGILLIDEVENGIHYSIQEELWRMIFRAADDGNVQVIAVTHSWDCIAGFAAVANEEPSVGALYRLERYEDDLHAVHYSEENLKVAAQQRIEVR